jgi:hypothetical protein
MTWDWPRTSHTESISRIISQFSGNSSTYLKHTCSSSNRAERMAQTRSGPAVQLELQFTHLLRTKKTGPGTLNCAGLQVAQPALPHWQVLHEGNQRVFRGHRTSQLIHFHNSRSHLRILANEAGPRITTTYCLHHSKPRTIPLDNLTDGTTRVPGKLPEVDGTGSTRIAKHPDMKKTLWPVLNQINYWWYFGYTLLITILN